MEIESAEYLKDGNILAIVDEGVVKNIPDLPTNRERIAVAVWETDGGVIAEYEADELTAQKISKLLFIDRLNAAGLFNAALAAL